MKTFAELFDTILTADKDSSRKAAREIRKLVYSSRDGGKYKDITSIIENAPVEYVKIVEDWRQENFVMAISVMYFLHSRENQPNFLFPWLFKLLQYENGNIRHAAVRMFGNELGPLTYHIRFPGKKSSFRELSPGLADRILFGLFANLNNLAIALWKPAYKKYKYISTLPHGPYKSVQMVLSSLEDGCGKEHMARLEQYLQEFFQWKSKLPKDNPAGKQASDGAGKLPTEQSLRGILST